MATDDVVVEKSASTNEGVFIDACENGKLDDVRRLLHGRADPNTRSSNRLFVLHLAANSGHLEVCRVLLDLSATVDAHDSADFTPMHYAAYHGHLDVIELLLARGAAADAIGSNGSAPLHLASAGDHIHVAQILLARGVDPVRRNLRHLSPADLARSESMRTLLERWAQPTEIQVTVLSGAEQRQARIANGTRGTVADLKNAATHVFGLTLADHQVSHNDTVLTDDAKLIAACGVRHGSVVRIQNRKDLVAQLAVAQTAAKTSADDTLRVQTECMLVRSELLEERARVQEVQALVTTTEARALRSDARATRAESQVGTLESDLGRARRDLAAATTRVDALAAELLEASERIRTLEHELLQTHAEKLQLQETSERDNVAHESQIRSFVSRIRELTQQLQEGAGSSGVTSAAYQALEYTYQATLLRAQMAENELSQHSEILRLMQENEAKISVRQSAQTERAAVAAAQPLALVPAPAAGAEEVARLRAHIARQDRAMAQANADIMEERFMAQACKSATAFKVLQTLGSGQNGIVVESRCVLPRHPCPLKSYALKICFNFDQDTLGASGAFVNEFIELAKLPRHPNIVRFYCDFFDEIRDDVRGLLPDFARGQSRIVTRGGQTRNRKTQFFVVEHLDVSLAAFLAEHYAPPAYVPQTFVARVIADMAAALMHLDRFRIAHRDMKLDNVLLQLDPADPLRVERCVLGDFGTACELNDAFRAPVSVSETGYILTPTWGNPSHIAPELHTALNAAVRAKKRELIELDYSHQAVFELGVLGYELVLADGPVVNYPGSCQSGAMGAVSYNDSLVQEIPGEALDPELAALLRGAVACQPEDRPTLDELHAGFSAFLR